MARGKRISPFGKGLMDDRKNKPAKGMSQKSPPPKQPRAK